MDFKLYFITDRHQTRGRGLRDVVRSALKAGCIGIQLREKDLSARELVSIAQGLKAKASEAKGKFFVNDRVDIAVGIGADGVHLTQRSLPAGIVRRYFKDILIGVSTHSIEEAIHAEKDGADFITFGPIFYTPSKASYGAPLGIDALKDVVDKVDIPVFAIGGIKKDRIRNVMGAGAYGVAMISAIASADDVARETSDIIREIEKTKGEAI